MSAQQASRRTGAVGVHSVNRVVYSVPELDEAQRFYTAFGLDNRREGDRLDLYMFGHSALLGIGLRQWRQRQAARVRQLRHLRGRRAVFRERVERRGIGCAAHPLADGTGLWLRIPTACRCSWLWSRKVSPSAKCVPSERVPVAAGHGAAPARSKVPPVRPRCLSHVLFFTPNVPRMVRFCSKTCSGFACRTIRAT